MIDDENCLGRLLNKGAETILLTLQACLQATLFPPLLGLGKFPLHSRHQPGQTVFHHEIAGARPQSIDGKFLGHRPGNQDQRRVRRALLQESERLDAAEVGKTKIRHDNFPLGADEFLPHLFGRLDSFSLDLKSARFQRMHHEPRIGGLVLDKQRPKDAIHGAGDGATSFKRSQ